MPRLNKPLITDWLIEHDRSAQWLSEKTEIPINTLKNAVWSGDQMRAGRIRILSRVTGIPEAELVAEEKKEEDEQPKEETTSPPKRSDKTTHPKRVQGTAA